jgi:hypothetical protein
LIAATQTVLQSRSPRAILIANVLPWNTALPWAEKFRRCRGQRRRFLTNRALWGGDPFFLGNQYQLLRSSIENVDYASRCGLFSMIPRMDVMSFR